MKIQSIDNQTFTSKNFRVIRPGVCADGLWLKYHPYVEEYSNPNAKQLYEKMSKEKNILNKMRLKQQLGFPKVKPLNIKEKVKLFFENMFQK